MKKETWKPIPGFAPYEVSDLGNIRRGPSGRILKRQKSACGIGHMLTVSIKGEKTTLRVARIVGAAFCPDFDTEKVPAFRNGNTNDYRAKNLKWVPRSEVTGVPYSVNPRK